MNIEILCEQPFGSISFYRGAANTPGEEYQTHVSSKASFGRFPVHVLLVGFPTALLAGVLLADIAYLSTLNAIWPEVAYWSLWAGVAGGLLASAAGLVDFITIRRVREYAAGWLHGGLNGAVLLLAILNLGLRQQDRSAITPWALTVSALTAALLIMASLYGHELVERHKIGDYRYTEERDDWL